jgi:hypothetical protein
MCCVVVFCVYSDLFVVVCDHKFKFVKKKDPAISRKVFQSRVHSNTKTASPCNLQHKNSKQQQKQQA